MSRTMEKAKLDSTAALAEPRVDKHSHPTVDQIAARAYEIYQARGGTDGGDVDDWLQAERELSEGKM